PWPRIVSSMSSPMMASSPVRPRSRRPATTARALNAESARPKGIRVLHGNSVKICLRMLKRMLRSIPAVRACWWSVRWPTQWVGWSVGVDANQVDPGAYAELGEDVAKVAVDSVRGQEQLVRDLPVSVPGHHKADDGQLRVRQARPVLRRPG